MIIAVSTKEPYGWVPELAQEAYLESAGIVERLLSSRTVGHATSREIQEIIELIREGDSSLRARRLREQLLRLPLAREGCVAGPDVQVGEVGVAEREKELIDSIYLLPTTEVASRALNPLPGAQKDWSREKVFLKNVAPLADRAVSVVLLDRFAGKSIVEWGHRSGAAWLMNRILESGVRDVVLLTAAVSRDVQVGDVLGDIPGLSEVRCVVGPASAAPHDRHLRFGFGNRRRGLVVSLPAGADIFRREELEQHYDINWGNTSVARRREVDFEEAAKRRS